MKNILKKVYYHKFFPRIFYKKPDGGKESGVTGYFLIEWKLLFSIGLLHFKEGSREAYHNHAFNALSFWLKGSVKEEKATGECNFFDGLSLRPKYTPRSNCHRVVGLTDTWALTFRGPWLDYWQEIRNDELVVLTHGRKKIN